MVIPLPWVSKTLMACTTQRVALGWFEDYTRPHMCCGSQRKANFHTCKPPLTGRWQVLVDGSAWNCM